MNRPSVSVVTTAFNAPATLRLVAAGLARQARPPFEWLVADDGSGPDVARAVQEAARTLPFPVTHVWQPNAGFRAARSRNNAAFRARGDILAFLDQDTVPHAGWLAAHADGLGPREVSLGDMAALTDEEAIGLDEDAVRSGRFETVFSPENRRRLARLQRRFTFYAVLRRLGLGVKAKPRLRSCNFALFRDLFRAVNGFDESYVGWGQEDDDLGRRLYAHGARPRVRIWAARVSHWPHPVRRVPDWKAGANVARYRAGMPPVFCEAGLSAHPHADVRVTAWPGASQQRARAGSPDRSRDAMFMAAGGT